MNFTTFLRSIRIFPNTPSTLGYMKNNNGFYAG